LRPAGNVVTDRDGPFLAVRNRSHARSVDAASGQVIAGDLRTTSPERNVVFARTALVGMTFDRDRVLRILLQPVGLLDERLRCFRRQLNRIRREVDDIADVLREVSLRSWSRCSIFAD
jgi:hypothetical protein